LMLATVSFPIYTKALINAILRRDQGWHVTGSRSRPTSPFSFMIPQVLFFAFLVITSVVGAWRDLGTGSLSLALAWNATNAAILGAFVVTAAREQRRATAAARAERRPLSAGPARRARGLTAAPPTLTPDLAAQPAGTLTGGAA
ncbi:MAG: glycosyl transferase family 2, partial [Actinotalea sp.]|nr:glycosyl transferase family 2 [Actinotalea sp.]